MPAVAKQVKGAIANLGCLCRINGHAFESERRLVDVPAAEGGVGSVSRSSWRTFLCP